MQYANVPVRHVGPIRIINSGAIFDVNIPLATFESPLWNSVGRGAKVSVLAQGITTVVFDDFMTRSIIVETTGIEASYTFVKEISSNITQIKNIIETSSKFIEFKKMECETIGPLVYIRISAFCSQASGHNMLTKASDAVASWMCQNFHIKYVSVSGNYCVDKKVSAINGISGRGKRVNAEITISKEICSNVLNSSPGEIHALNIKKNLVGSTLAGSIRSANAHFANILVAAYIATGQDPANIVEGSQGITYTDVLPSGDLYFSVNIPNIIVGVLGSGKTLEFAVENLRMMGCLDNQTTSGAQRFACIICSAVLCGELSLLAALNNPGELIRSHILLERSAINK